MFNNDLKMAIKAALDAGKKILEIYFDNHLNVEFKLDNSPLTKADSASHYIINKKLSKSIHNILSEEGSHIDFSIRKNWKKFWLIDPLDGTKEFIKKNGEFTINIALIENQTPILGVVYAPITKELYFANKGLGSFKMESIIDYKELETRERINLSNNTSTEKYTIVVSRSHLNDQTIDFINKKKEEYGKVKILKFGSSLKICKVAERKAHCYPRLGPTMEWDTAAAHAIVKYSGKNILNYSTKTELSYNKENLLNPNFVVF